jgi:hypothetical protein
MKETAVVDIDNTLWQFCDPFYEELKKINSTIPPIEQWTTADFWKPYCSLKEFMDAINAIHRAQDSEQYRPYPESREFLAVLKERGYQVIIASHRLEGTRTPAERWLSRHQLPYDELHLSFDKTVLFDRAAVVVDDAPQTLEKAVAHCAIGAGLLFPWNRSSARNGFGLFHDLTEVLTYILRPRTAQVHRKRSKH